VGEPHDRPEERGIRCVLCGERIGVYEPAVFVGGAVVKRTSRAAMPGIEEIVDYRPFHGPCYDASEAARV